ncbi:helix-turn-helix domain-containing protein [Paeniglutamicibacter kerguelensis]|uniref:AraC-like DNA-binding protein n=1 Tax=Paeniglutamicibacter kerguelensis TaxID=254788 RepID=A0ABS4XFY6_9MICC|nr:helix-turn-helix domain-containing protein [Paeniglutamicibacter kerguelensis]MBP2387381.1 AraC-like DNA-binding protein [Paeniglutamicibacter kerguelensis]
MIMGKVDAVSRVSVLKNEPEEGLRRFDRRFSDGGLLKGARSLRSISGPCIIRPLMERGFVAHIRTWMHDRLLVTYSTGDGVSLLRTSQFCGDGFERFVLVCMLASGRMAANQRGTDVEAGPGDALILLPGEPYTAHIEDGSDTLAFFVARGFFDSQGINTDLLNVASIQVNGAVSALAALSHWAMQDRDSEVSGHTGHIERAILEILAGVVTTSMESLDDSDAETIKSRGRVLELIDSCFADPDLSADSIARQVGMSRRNLYRLFEGKGPGITQMIRDRRLDHAQVLLRRMPETSIGAVAIDSGFSGSDQFSRAFKERHGQSASQYREAGGVDAPTEF